MKAPRWTVLLAVAVMAAILIAVASAASARGTKSDAGPYKIALANSFIGDTWRVRWQTSSRADARCRRTASRVTCSVYNSGNDVGKQTQQISNLISQKVDAIVLNAASPTGLNGIIKQACDRGIVVVSFDNVVTAPCARQ